LEEQIAHFMLRAAKFEFYLVNRDTGFAQTRRSGTFDVIAGIQWGVIAQQLQVKQPFETFDFTASAFNMFRQTAPQFLVKDQNGRPRWDSDNEPVESWDRLLGRGFAQLRNNIAHGNKAQVPGPFTHSRSLEFIQAGNALIDFVAVTLFDEPRWETPIAFR